MADILIVDDEVGIRDLLSEILSDEGHAVRQAENAAQARSERNERVPNLVLLDIWMPDTDGISLLKEWNTSGQLMMPVVMMSGHGTIDAAVEATRFGAVDFLEKPIALQKLLATVQKALKHDRIGQRPPATLDALRHTTLFRDLKKRLEQSAARANSLLLKGGVGLIAELSARTLQRPRSPWLDLREYSGTLTQEVLQKTAGGLIYVGDLAALGKMQQMNLAFALDRAGRHNILVVAATAQPLETLAEKAWDLHTLKRISEVVVFMPDLLQHASDLPDICNLFLNLMAERGETPARCFSPGALSMIRANWPGRDTSAIFSLWDDLQALIRSLALSSLDDEEICEEELARLVPNLGVQHNVLPVELENLFSLPLREARDAFEKRYFEHLLRGARGNMTRVSDHSGLERTHLYRKMKQLGIAVGKRHGTD
ncbi:MAG: response regulator [Betaproteobacteria bacterium]|nr:response regulator [Betaproteobacteria bacterium]